MGRNKGGGGGGGGRRARSEDGRGGSPGRPGKRKRGGALGPHAFKAIIPNGVVAGLMGSKGAAIAEIQEQCQSHLQFSPRGQFFPGTEWRVMTVTSETPDGIADVLDRIVDATANEDDEARGRFAGEVKFTSLLARHAVGSLLGRGGEDMRRLQADLDCYIEVEKNPCTVDNHQKVEVRGKVEDVKQAMKVVNQKVQGEVHREWFPAWAAQDPLGGRPRHLATDSAAGVGPRGGGGDIDPDMPAPSLEELDHFRDAYPMDDTAWEFICNSSGLVQTVVLRDFAPPNGTRQGEDYSALIMAFCSRVAGRLKDTDTARPARSGGGGNRGQPRSAVASSDAGSAGSRSGAIGGGGRSIGREAEDFRRRFPVDNRAWDFFLGMKEAIRLKVMKDFKPGSLRGGEKDYSAVLMSFMTGVARREQESPQGFKQGLLDSGGGSGGRGGRGRSPDRAPRGASGGGAGGKGGEQTGAEALARALKEAPKRYFDFDYALNCHLPADSCRPIEECMKDVAHDTRTQIDLDACPGEDDGTLVLNITGRVPDVYTAHIRLMCAFNHGKEEPAPVSGDIDAMQQQIAMLQSQLEVVKQQALGR